MGGNTEEKGQNTSREYVALIENKVLNTKPSTPGSLAVLSTDFRFALFVVDGCGTG